MAATHHNSEDAPPLSGVATLIWDRLEAAAEDRAHPMRLHTVATVTADGDPDARILMLRGAERESARLWFHTDVRSPKVAQLAGRPRVCSVCYDPRDCTQIRLVGDVIVHNDDEVARRHWEQVELAIRRVYAHPGTSGDLLTHPDMRMRDRTMEIESGRTDDGMANLAVVELRLESIDWLRVCESGDERAALRARDDWRPSRIVP